MGLCKCPRHKVTNLFCFEHKVNVCEECLAHEHYSCMVRSYLQWLQDSDYTSTCPICQESLIDSSKGPCVRLLCLDVFHFSCLDQCLSPLPPNTTPAGYECPVCRQCVFPKTNQAGPVAEILRGFLQQTSWGRAGMSIEPVFVESQHSLPQVFVEPPSQLQQPQQATANIQGDFSRTPVTKASTGQRARFDANPPVNPVSVFSNNSMDLMSEAGATFQPNPTPPVDTRRGYSLTNSASASLNMQHVSDKPRDYDDNKYARRPALTWLARWIKTYFPSHHSRYSPQQRYLLILTLLILGFLFSLYFLASVGRQIADQDPMLDPRNNPNILIQRDGPDMHLKVNDAEQMQHLAPALQPDSHVLQEQHAVHEANDLGM